MPLTDRSDSLVTRNLTVQDSLELDHDTTLEVKEMPAPPTPPTGSLFLYAKTDGKLYVKNDAGTESDLTAGAGGGEANTAGNVGTGGVGLFKQKVGVNLEFKKINAGSGKITVTDDTANDEVDLDLGSVALTDLSDVSAKTGTGTTAVLQNSPSLTTPTIGDLTNVTHNHQNAAGGGTLDAAAIAAGTLDSARLAAKNKTVEKILYVENPAASDVFPLLKVPDACTLVRVTHQTDTGTVDFNLEKRAEGTPATAGTDVWTTDKQAGSTMTGETSFNSAAIPADNWLIFSASAVASSPTKLWISIEYTIN